MAEPRVLYGGQGGSILEGGGLFLYGGGSWRPGIPSLWGGGRGAEVELNIEMFSVFNPGMDQLVRINV